MNEPIALIHSEQIEQAILLIHGQRVMLDRDLAALYGVTTSNLNKAVKRNLDRFPADFMFQLTLEEAQACAGSRFQIGILKRGQNIKYLPHVFTQEGVAMLSGVLRSPRAVQVNIAIMRVFVRLRETSVLHKEFARKLAELERNIEGHDQAIKSFFDAIRELMAPPAKPRREIGFHAIGKEQATGGVAKAKRRRVSDVMSFPKMVDLALPAEGVFQNLVFESIKKTYPMQAYKIMHGLWGMGQMMFTKHLVVVDDDVNVHNTSEVLFRLCANTDPQRDSIFTRGPSDVLDHATSEIGVGTKLGFDATRKLPGEGFKRPWPPLIKMDESVKARVAKILNPWQRT